MSLKNGTLILALNQSTATNKPPDAFPSSAAFDEISRSLSSSESDRASAIKTGGAIFAFTLKNSAGTQESWHIDLKETGTVGKGVAPEGKKAAVTLVLSDVDFGKLVQGKANAQKLFMSGKLKVRGDVMKATKLEPVLKKARTEAKL
jgi:putative sterol carrier protein